MRGSPGAGDHISAWTFYWTAPASGTVRMFYGGVDGDCDMMSMGDAVVVGSMTLKTPSFARPSPGLVASQGFATYAVTGIRVDGGALATPSRGRGRS